MRKLHLMGLSAVMMIVLFGCGQVEVLNPGEPVEEPPLVVEHLEPVPDPDETKEKEPEAEAEPIVPILPYTLPLTGAGSAEQNDDRPVVVMVENSPSARPQSGLHQADIVYEMLAEGDITRFVAVYQSEKPEIIGPVRSIRPYMINLAKGFDSVIVHAGWSPAAQRTLTDPNQKFATIDGVNGGSDGAYFWRSRERSAPNNLYTSMEKILDRAEKKKFRANSKDLKLQFAAEDYTPAGDQAEKVKVHYIQGYNVSYEYDKEKGYYHRYLLGKPHNDKETGIQITASNIIIAKSSHKTLDKVGRRSINVTGPGNGLLIQGGKAVEVTWESKDGVIRAFKDGEELKWMPGKTWVQIVPIGSLVELE